MNNIRNARKERKMFIKINEKNNEKRERSYIMDLHKSNYS